MAHAPLLGGKLPDPVGVIATIGEQHRFGLQARQEYRAQPIVVRLTGRQREPDRQAIGIDDRVNLAGQTRLVTGPSILLIVPRMQAPC